MQPSGATTAVDSLDSDVLAALRAQAERDLARRFVFGTMMYFVIVLVVAVGTAYGRDHPGSIIAFGTLTFSLGAGRLAVALRMRSEAGPDLFRWAGPLRRFTELQLAVWGAFTWWTLKLYGFERVSLLVLLITAIFAGGVLSSLSPDLALARRGLQFVVLPPTAWGAFQGTREGWILVAFGAVYFAFQLLQVREHHDAYWATSVTAARAVASERDRLFQVAFETAPAGIALIGCDGQLRRVNRRLCSMFGRTEHELVGSEFPSLLEEPEHRQDWLEALKIGIAAREAEERFSSSSGAPLWGAVSLAAVGSGRPEAPRYYVAMILDVTERKRAESERHEMEAQLLQAEKLASIGMVVGGIAHDFNNLLMVVQGYAELAAVEMHGSPLAEDMGEIAKAVERTRTLADQLIVFSRRQIMQQEILSLNEIVSETSGLLQRTVGSHIQIDLSLDHAIQDVKVDAGQIQRVLLNLVLNARDAMPEGGRISIATRMADAPASTATTMGPATSLVALTVTDTGGGMNAGTKKRAFEPFFTTKESGSGLGLASVYRVVKQNGGEIRVESDLERGTMVEILLPLASAASTDLIGKKTAQDRTPHETSGTAAVLVAEAEPAVRRLIETILASSGYEVSSAATGEEALKIFLENPKRFDVLLTDVVVPGMSGRNLADRVRQRRSSIGVVYMTVHSASEIAAHEVVEPNVRVLAKPFTPEDLRRTIKLVLGEEADGASA